MNNTTTWFDSTQITIKKRVYAQFSDFYNTYLISIARFWCGVVWCAVVAAAAFAACFCCCTRLKWQAKYIMALVVFHVSQVIRTSDSVTVKKIHETYFVGDHIAHYCVFFFACLTYTNVSFVMLCTWSSF